MNKVEIPNIGTKYIEVVPPVKPYAEGQIVLVSQIPGLPRSENRLPKKRRQELKDRALGKDRKYNEKNQNHVLIMQGHSRLAQAITAYGVDSDNPSVLESASELTEVVNRTFLGRKILSEVEQAYWNRKTVYDYRKAGYVTRAESTPEWQRKQISEGTELVLNKAAVLV